MDKILNAKDFYDILSVSKDATEDDVKKSYRKVRIAVRLRKWTQNNSRLDTEKFLSLMLQYLWASFGFLNSD